MKAIIVLIISAALVLQCQSVDTSQMTDYLDASKEAWENTYKIIAGVHYDYTGRVEVMKMDTDPKNVDPANKLGSYPDKCNLNAAGVAYEAALETWKDTLYTLRITWNPREAVKAQSEYNQANSAMEKAKSNYNSKIDCDNKAFDAFKASVIATGKTAWAKYWTTLLSEERRRYKEYGVQSGNTWFSIVYGDKCGVFKNWNLWNDRQYESNWATFQRDRWESPDSKGALGQKAYQAWTTNNNAWAAYKASQACEKADPIPQALLVEIDNWKKKDISDAQKMYTICAAAKLRSNDPCVLESDVNNWVNTLQSYRMYHYLELTSKSAKKIAENKIAASKPYAEFQKAANDFEKGLTCNNADIAKVAAQKAAKAAATAANIAAAAAAKAAAKKAAEDARLRSEAAKNSYMIRLKRDAENYANKGYWGQMLNTYCRAGHPPIPSWQKQVEAKCRMYTGYWEDAVKRFMDRQKKNFNGKVRRRLNIFSH